MGVAFWLWVALAFGIIEAVSPALVCIWLGFGAVITALVSIYIKNIIWQLGVFLVSSVVLFLATKDRVRTLLGRLKVVATNSDSIIGKDAIVIEEVNNLESTGRIMVENQNWSCKNKIDEVIKKGSVVKIMSIQGNKAVVEFVSDKH